MHIHIRTSVPGIEKALPLDFFFVFGILSRILPIRAAEFAAHAHSRIQGEILAEGGGEEKGWRVGGPGRKADGERKSERVRERERKMEKGREEGEDEGDGRIGRIENRRAIRETQRKDSITSHKESKGDREKLISGRHRQPCRRTVRREEKTDGEEGTSDLAERSRRRRRRGGREGTSFARRLV